MREKPAIAILIPHYNNVEGLCAAIESIRETIPLKVLVVDDGSRADPIDEEQLRTRAAENLQLSFTYLPKNKGIQYALNAGLDVLRKDDIRYIARLDCDDICTSGRFQKQLDFMESHSEVAIVGSFIQYVDPDGNPLFKLKLPITHESIKKRMFINAMLIHPAIFFRKEVLEKVPQYPTEYKAAEDYAFYFELLKHYQFANIPEVLVQCEMNPEGISGRSRKNQLKNRLRLILKHFDYSPMAFYGILRNSIIYITPTAVLFQLKKAFK